MNNIPRPKSFDDSLEVWSKLMALADMIEIDADSGALTIQNGKSRAILHPDGTIRIEGTRIVQSAERNIALDAA
ncbi:hypothetical protein, partial [Fulvimarina sp. MAC8]|uniref:hypothetical protein n=1 Tax=Fulvimarina sp. MAC8 TaxID=3162874 RepID=UPI0032EBA197